MAVVKLQQLSRLVAFVLALYTEKIPDELFTGHALEVNKKRTPTSTVY